MEIIWDIEANGLAYPSIDKKGNSIPRADRVWCIVAREAGSERVYTYGPNEIERAIDFLSRATLWIGHNLIGYDIPVLSRFGLVRSCPVLDTLIVSRLMYPDKQDVKFPLHDKKGRHSHSLEAWGRKLGDDKQDYDGGWEHYSDEMLEYCIQDVAVNEKIYNYQKEWVKENQKVVQFEHLVGHVCADMTKNGFRFDCEAASELQRELLETKADIEDNLQQTFPTLVEERWSEKTGKRLKDKVTVFNPASTKQIAERFKVKYSWKAPVSEKGNPNCDTKVLKSLKFPEARSILEYRDAQKLLGMVDDWMLRACVSGAGTIHGQFNHQGAATGRATHSQPNIAQVDKNPKSRRLWKPHDGHVQVGSDLSGLELRMLAHQMAEFDGGAYAKEILEGDIHTTNMNAAGLSNRDQAKTFIYGFLYGAGSEKIGQIVGGNARDGQQLKDKFLRRLPALKKVIQNVQFQSAKYGSVVLLDGRRVPVRSDHAALNTLLQGNGAIVSKLWIVLAHRSLSSKGVKMMGWIHDEIQTSCPPNIAEETGKELVRCAQETGKKLGIRMPVDAEYVIGESWADTH
jgi:DNA polymerase I-like protein with 3'-5' exonuclease and polymerase domains